jgi:hypothetical protein
MHGVLGVDVDNGESSEDPFDATMVTELTAGS